MTLAPGTRLGPYEIVAPLGAGGMGEVWRARDTRLGREVAIKVLPAAFAADPALRARFDREAKTISSLNHPNICTLYDVGREGDTDYLVLELVEGETLALRIARGPLPLADLLRYGMQTTDALEKAHKAGIVHRDLKPGNIMLTKAGAKLLDFGLARGGPQANAPADATISPTMTGPLTAQGHIVGTFQYMAPEQLEGTEADARSDLWALGCVLYEMATGKPAFAGTSQASLISSIMKDEPKPLGELAPMSPPALDRAIRQCLAKDPDERWQSAGDLKRELAWISASGSQASAIAAGTGGGGRAGVRPTLGRRLRAWALPFVLGAGLAALAWFALDRPAPDSPARVAVVHPPGSEVVDDPADQAISPDGSSIAYVASDSTTWILCARRLDGNAPRELARSPFPIRTPFWSPDSRQVAYFTSGEDGRLWRVSAEGGTPVALAPASTGRGGAWNREGTIVFAPAPAGPLFRVSVQGEGLAPVTAIDSTAGESGHRAPRFLEDGKHFIYTVIPPTAEGFAIRIGSLEGKTSEPLVRLPEGGAEYAAPGFLLYQRQGNLVARVFDPRARKLVGDPFPVVAGVGTTSTLGHPVVSAARSGRLSWIPAAVPNSRLEWFDRTGRSLGRVDAPEGNYEHVAVSPEGRRGLAARYQPSGEIEVYLIDPDQGAPRRVSPPGWSSYMPVWAPDGESFFMRANAAGRDEIYRVSLVRPGDPELVPTTDHQFKGPSDVTEDGRTLLFFVLARQTGWDLWSLDLATEGARPQLVLDDPSETDAVYSPDGRFLAIYTLRSNSDLHVAPVDRARQQRRVAANLGKAISWSGNELLFDRSEGEGQAILALPMDRTSSASAGPERVLFRRGDMIAWSVSRDGQRFLLSLRKATPSRTYLELALDWTKLPRDE